MARKTSVVTITEEGRDQGKIFQLTEMSATQTEKFATRLFLAMAKSGLEIPDGLAQSGIAGLASLGLKALAGINFIEAEPLLDEMMICIKIIPDASRPEVVRALVESDIEEITTRLLLRKELFYLHVNFSRPVTH